MRNNGNLAGLKSRQSKTKFSFLLMTLAEVSRKHPVNVCISNLNVGKHIKHTEFFKREVAKDPRVRF